MAKLMPSPEQHVFVAAVVALPPRCVYANSAEPGVVKAWRLAAWTATASYRRVKCVVEVQARWYQQASIQHSGDFWGPCRRDDYAHLAAYALVSGGHFTLARANCANQSRAGHRRDRDI